MEQKIPKADLPRANSGIPDDVVCIWTKEDIEALIKRILSGEEPDQNKSS